MNFETLLKSLAEISGNEEDLNAGAGAEGGDAGGDAGADAGAGDAGGDGGDAGGDEGGDAFGKSLKVVDESGEERDVVDATDILKSLVDRADSAEDDLSKALQFSSALLDLVKSQATQIADLGGKLDTLANQGRGRRAVVSLADKPDLTKGLPGADAGTDGGDDGKGDDAAGMQPAEFMAKALDAMGEGKITGGDLAQCEARLNRGLQPDAAIVSKVLG